ncbi:MAG: radical SAM protein [Candidatus Moraniibacteriota bacterium]
MFSRLILPLTYRCNLNCEYCYVDKQSGKSMSLKTALDAVDFLLKNARKNGNAANIIFVGGEPLLEWVNIVKIVRYAKRLASGMGVSIGTIGFPTNGLLLTRDILDFCRAEHVSVAVSIDGSDNKRKTVAGGNSFPHVGEKIPLLLEYRDIVRIRSTVHPDHVEGAAERFKEFLGMGFSKIDLQPVIGIFWTPERTRAYVEQLEETLISVERMKAITGTGVDLKHLRDFNSGQSGELGCPKIREEFLVDIGGTIYPCEFYLSFPLGQRETYAIGDIKNGVGKDVAESCLRHILCESDDFLPIIKSKCASCTRSQACSKICLGYDQVRKRFDKKIAASNWVLFREIEKLFGAYEHLS